jgi:hypothetical protein
MNILTLRKKQDGGGFTWKSCKDASINHALSLFSLTLLTWKHNDSHVNMFEFYASINHALSLFSLTLLTWKHNDSHVIMFEFFCFHHLDLESGYY